jgi:hypothetical protein
VTSLVIFVTKPKLTLGQHLPLNCIFFAPFVPECPKNECNLLIYSNDRFAWPNVFFMFRIPAGQEGRICADAEIANLCQSHSLCYGQSSLV